MRTIEGVVRDNVIVLPADVRLPDGSTVVVLVPEHVTSSDDEAQREARLQEDLRVAGIVQEPPAAATRSGRRPRRLITVAGAPLSQLIIEARS